MGQIEWRKTETLGEKKHIGFFSPKVSVFLLSICYISISVSEHLKGCLGLSVHEQHFYDPGTLRHGTGFSKGGTKEKRPGEHATKYHGFPSLMRKGKR